jgi:hypothetical protein
MLNGQQCLHANLDLNGSFNYEFYSRTLSVEDGILLKPVLERMWNVELKHYSA